jgi:hypothetical protein
MIAQTKLTLLAALVALASLALVACSPALNWREVRPENTRLALLLPCKPDKAQKTVPLGGTPTPLSMVGCDADGATFAVAVAELADATQAADVLAQWQRLALVNMRATGAAQVTPLKLQGAAPDPAPVRVRAQGTAPDGSAVTGEAAYFVQGSQVFQAVLYVSNANPEAAETFFSSLRFE